VKQHPRRKSQNLRTTETLVKGTKWKGIVKGRKDKLESALENTTELFDGKLGLYKNEEIHLEIEPSAKQYIHELTLFQSLKKKLSNEKWTIY
jgi:hypothetical protein